MRRFGLLVDTIKRFPAAGLLALANVWFVWCAFAEGRETGHVPLALLSASGLAIVFSAAAGLVAERFAVRRWGMLAAQSVALTLFGVLAWTFSGYGVFESHFLYSYDLTLIAFAALMAAALGGHQKPDAVFPALTFAAVMGVVVGIAVGGGVSLIVLVVEKLFCPSISGRMYEVIWGAAFASVGTEFFLAYATRREPFEFPKAWRVLVVFVLFPLYLVLLTVVWLYLAKCVVTRELPNGQINWIVSTTSVFWMGFHLMLGGFEGRAIWWFRRFAALVILPLVALQVVALAIRLGEYGLTPARYSSFLFAGFSVLFAVLALARPRRANGCAFLSLAAIALFAALSPWNVVDASVRAQQKRLAAFAERRKAGEKFDAPTRHSIMGTWEFVNQHEQVNGHFRKSRWLSNDKLNAFHDEWGFNYLNEYDRRTWGGSSGSGQAGEYRSFCYERHTSAEIAGFSRMTRYQIVRHGDDLVIDKPEVANVSTNAERIVVTAQVKAAYADGKDPNLIVFDLADGRRVVVDRLSFCLKRHDSWADGFDHVHGECLLLEK